MAEANELKVTGPFGIDLAAKGPILLVILTIAAFTTISLWEHYKTRQIIDRITCNLGIVVFAHHFPKGGIDWDELPIEYYYCMPDYARKMPKGR